MVRAYRFSDIEALADFLRLHDSAPADPAGFRLYQVRRGQRRELLLLGLPEPKGLRRILFRAAAESVAVEERGDGLALRRGRASLELEVESRRSARTLLDLIATRPWRGEPEGEGALVFWLAAAEDLAELVRRGLRLRCDGLRFASLERDAVLLRVERCPRVLLRAALEDFGERVRVFWLQSAGVHVRWGQAHPLAAAWGRAAERSKRWLFFDAGERAAIERPAWRDIYAAAEPSLEQLPALTEIRSAEAGALRFTVSLFPVKRDPPAEPELWMLGPEDRPRLEHLVSGMSAEELRAVMMSVQRDSQGRELLFLRPRDPGRSARGFGGRRFARLLGFRGLFLPIDRDLEPRLRRDQYRRLFALSGSDIVIYDPDGGAGGQVLRLEAASFESLERLVDHIMAADRERLTRVAAAAVFDLGRYARAAARVSPEGEEPAAASPPTPAATPERVDPQPAPVLEERAQPEARPVDAAVPEPDSGREAELERALIQDGPELDRWGELARLKSALGKPREAAACAVDALWLAPKEASATWRAVLIEAAAAAGEPELAAAARALSGPKPGEDEAAWLEELGPLLRDEEARMRKKLRWLSWSALIRRSGDERRWARVRGAILDELDQFGLALHDIPGFLQARISRERWSEEEGSDADERAAASKNLSRVAARLSRGADAALRRAAQAALGRGFARIGEGERALECLAAFGRAQGPAALQAAGQLFALDLIALTGAPPRRRLQRSYEAAYGNLSPDTRASIDELARSLERREDAESPGAFLASLDQRELFPRGGDVVPPPYRERGEALRERAREPGGLTRALTETLRFLREELAEGRDLRGIAWLLDRAARAAASQGGEAGGAEPSRELRPLAHALKGKGRSGDGFYRAVARLAAARVVLELEGPAAAQKALTECLSGGALAGLGALDLMDLLKNVVLPSVEDLDLAHRGEALERAAGALSRQIDEEKASFELGSFALIALRLIDQMAAASFSKDRLALRLFRRYRDRDEWLLRERVLGEDLLGGQGDSASGLIET